MSAASGPRGGRAGRGREEAEGGTTSTACRTALLSLPLFQGEHAGLTLARCLRAHKEMDPTWATGRQTPEVQLLEAVRGCQAGPAYQQAFARWEKTARERGFGLIRATLAGPLALGLGNESPLEVGITTHFTYGMPVIPGPALKGLCRRGAMELERQGKLTKEQFKHLFGWTDKDSAAEALVTFFDGWYDPESVQGKPYHRDVVTVHHPGYYSSRGKNAWPTDFDDPIPVPFLVVKPGARFLFAIGSRYAEWRQFAMELLQWSLENLGAGAKTSAGYGRFRREAAAAGGGGPAGAPGGAAAAGEVWTGAVVKRNPGSGQLTAAHGTGTAIATGTAAATLFSGLAESARAQLKDRKKPITADVEVERVGNQITIKRIKVAEGG